ncbi:MAG: hypothetical protein HLUCCA11_09980 [Phormidesmis priestleyi Ana]|uniref:Uncharacterized protein n=1 Tax=Phormidesmis priestleyi Ana TaxID=1666911 RepID=A0A0N8KN52_9CYAN|nr:MAG: hypothetical protein HLUCCA11_09980 [Phormidesmis priestleyi Ana]
MKAVVFHDVGDTRLDNVAEPKVQSASKVQSAPKVQSASVKFAILVEYALMHEISHFNRLSVVQQVHNMPA